MKIFLLISLLVRFSTVSSATQTQNHPNKIETQLIIAFLNDNDCSLTYFLFCSSKKSTVSLRHHISESPKTHRVAFILEKSLLSINFKAYNKMCFIMDVECGNASIFEEVCIQAINLVIRISNGLFSVSD